MFLHIGKNITILEKDIIAIIDKKTIEESEDTKGFIQNIIDYGYLYNNNVNNVNNVKTYIITHNGTETKLYTSNISATTLSKRNKDIKRELEVKSSGQ